MEISVYSFFFLLDFLTVIAVTYFTRRYSPTWAVPEYTLLWLRRLALLISIGMYIDFDFSAARKKDRSESAMHRVVLALLLVNNVADAYCFVAQMFVFIDMANVVTWGIEAPDPDRAWLNYVKLGLQCACILYNVVWTWLYAFDVDFLTMARRFWPQFQYAQQHHQAAPQASLQPVYTSSQPSYTSVAQSPMMYSSATPAVATMNVYAAQPAPPPQQMLFQAQPQPQMRSVIVTGPSVSAW